MMINVTVSLPTTIFDIYARAANKLKDYSVEQVLSAALHAYAQYLFNEMVANGELEK